MGGGAIATLWSRVRQRFHPPGTFDFRGFPVDGQLATNTGAPPEHYAAFAALHERLLAEHTPIEPQHVVLEAGCGTGMDAMLLTGRLSRRGRYTGFDIAADNIAWCTAHITSRFPNFRFVHFDVANSTYNPTGTLAPTGVRFPEADGVVDRFIAQSVFTHLVGDVAAHYLAELRRVLAPGGRALISCFVGTPQEIAASVASPVPVFRFAHRWAPGVWVCDPQRPADSVAYERETFARLLADAGLALRTLAPGYWVEGRGGQEIGQDIAVLSRADAPSA